MGYSATLSAASGYILPDTITVTIGGVACNDFTYNSTTGVVTIPAACVSGAIVISATAEEDLPDTYPVTFPTDANISTTGNTTATEGEDYSITLSVADGYVLPDTITVTIDGVACNDFTYNSTTGVVTIPAACVSGAIAISAVAVEEENDKLFIVGSMSDWSFVEMSKDSECEGEYFYEIIGEAGETVKFKFTFESQWKDEISLAGGDNFEVTIPEDGSIKVYVNTNKLGNGTPNGENTRYECELSYGVSGECAVNVDKTILAGDATPYVGIAIVAILALAAFMILASKKRTMTE